MAVLIPHLVDQKARTDSAALYLEYPINAANYRNGFRKVSYGDFANAVNFLAWWLHKTIGPSESFETLAYVGPNDIRCPALILAAVKAGYVMFLPSPRNSIAAQKSLLNRLQCTTLLSPSPQPPPAKAILDAHDMRAVEVPSVEEILASSSPHYEYNRDPATAPGEPLFIIHTSGSTGIPKPITYTHETATRNINMTSLEPPIGFESLERLYQGNRIFITFPPFHAASLALLFFNAVPFGTTVITPISASIPSAQSLVETLKQTPVNVAFLVPSIVQELGSNHELLEFCAQRLQAIIYCGGDLPKEIGDKVASKIRLLCQYGASELGLVPSLLSANRSPGDWKYCQFHPDIGSELRPATEATSEFRMVRDSKKENVQPTFALFPDLNEYQSRDLFVQHPSQNKPSLWTWNARADDIIVFLTGEKTNPISMEQYLVAHESDVTAALVVGAQRFQAALLLETTVNVKKTSAAERAAYIEKIWPTIEEANKDAPAHARIAKSHVLLTSAENPMLRAGKGTIQRSGTLSMYATEIKDLYVQAEISTPIHGAENKRSTGDLNEATLTRIVKDTFVSVTNMHSLKDSDDLFALGMDSLQATLALRELKRRIHLPQELALSTIYTNPSISQLTTALTGLSKTRIDAAKSSHEFENTLRAKTRKEYEDKIDQMTARSFDPNPISQNEQPLNVMLTGSTGAIGSHILDSLLRNGQVHHVYCLNRACNSEALQRERNNRRGLQTPLDPSRVTFLTTDFSVQDLGLEIETYKRLQSEVSLLIHNAWPVNFNFPLQSFQPQIDGLLHLLRFASASSNSLHIFFISSISSVMGSRNAVTSEQIVKDDSAPGPNGYASSKYIAERLLDHAASHLNISVSVARVGQIAGSVKHASIWNPAEWFPSLVISSAHIGAIPDSLGPTFNNIDWIPIDFLADAITEISLRQAQMGQQEPPSIRVFHPMNPHPMPYAHIRDLVVQELALCNKPVTVTGLDAWLERVRQAMESNAGSSDDDMAAAIRWNPAIKLLDFYQGVLGAGDEATAATRLDGTNTLRESEVLRDLQGLRDEWIVKWVREWRGEMQ